MNIITQTRLFACVVLLVCCLVTAVFNSIPTTSIVNLLTFLVAFVVLLQELKRAQSGVNQVSGADKSSIIMLGSALIAGASLVGGIMSTDIMDGFSMYVDIHGQTYKATHGNMDNESVAVIILILSYAAWIVSMITFLCSLRVSGGAKPELK